MRALIVMAGIAGLFAATAAMAATAIWTGQQEMVTTVTGKSAWKCYYNYNGQIFTQIFETSCPSSIEIQ
jgi:hypothetical protein